jgi:hypothetical protein
MDRQQARSRAARASAAVSSSAGAASLGSMRLACGASGVVTLGAFDPTGAQSARRPRTSRDLRRRGRNPDHGRNLRQFASEHALQVHDHGVPIKEAQERPPSEDETRFHVAPLSSCTNMRRSRCRSRSTSAAAFLAMSAAHDDRGHSLWKESSSIVVMTRSSVSRTTMPAKARPPRQRSGALRGR